MLTLTYGHVKNPAFLNALAKLAHQPMKSPKAAYSVARIVKALSDETSVVQAAFLKMLKAYALLDEKGEFVPNDGIPGTYQIPEDRVEEWKKVNTEFNLMTFDAKGRKICVDELAGDAMSAHDMLTLADILEGEQETPQPCHEENATSAPPQPSAEENGQGRLLP
jgi:hypothetical protein